MQPAKDAEEAGTVQQQGQIINTVEQWEQAVNEALPEIREEARKALGENNTPALEFLDTILSSISPLGSAVLTNPAAFSDEAEGASEFFNRILEQYPGEISTEYAQGLKDGFALLSKAAESDKKSSAVLKKIIAAKEAEFAIHTGQELDTLARGQSAGKSMSPHFKKHRERQALTYQNPGDTHFLEIGLTKQDTDAGLDLSFIENLVAQQDADAIIATFYVLQLLTPKEPVPIGLTPTARVDLDDIIKKIGWVSRSTEEKQQMRSQVWSYLLFGDRAHIRGIRSGLKIDPDTRKQLETSIDAPLWRIGATESGVQPSLIPAYEVPRIVELLLSREMIPFLTDPRMTQYLPCGDVLGSISPNQASGAWARVIGMSAANFWRRNHRETLAARMYPTRRELLTHYIPKKSPISELREGKNPRRAQEYWKQALSILVSEGFLVKEGEALQPNSTHWDGYEWLDSWLDEKVVLIPGIEMTAALKLIASHSPPLKPRDLTAKQQRRTRKAATSS